MKKLLVGLSILLNGYCFGQGVCGKSSPLFMIDNAAVGNGKEITALGSNPEFPFLRNKSSAAEVYNAAKRNERNAGKGHTMFNDLLVDIGFTHGVQDLTLSAITAVRIPFGTEGNMGSGSYTYSYDKLDVDANGIRAWKISSGPSCYLYILAKCGNAFYPNPGPRKTACINVPVNLTGDTKDVTLDGGNTIVTTDRQYVYYHRRKHAKRALAPEFADDPDPNSSNPVLVNITKSTQVVPQSYKITVNSPDDNVTVCPDSALSVPANINVEKVSEYAGYYPATSKKNYKEVSKRKYKKIARKMRKSEHKENKVARLTGTQVDVAVKG